MTRWCRIILEELSLEEGRPRRSEEISDGVVGKL